MTTHQSEQTKYEVGLLRVHGHKRLSRDLERSIDVCIDIVLGFAILSFIVLGVACLFV